MDDEQILARGGDEHDIRAYAEQTANFSEEEAEAMKTDFKLFAETYFPKQPLNDYQLEIAERVIRHDKGIYMMPPRPGGMRTLNEMLKFYYEYDKYKNKNEQL